MDNHTALVVGSSDRSQEKHPGSVAIAQTKENPSMFFFSDFLCFLNFQLKCAGMTMGVPLKTC